MEQEKQPKKRGRKKRVVENNIDSIIYNDLEFIPSKHQKDIFYFMLHGVGNAVVRAVAGSGKTTTATNAIKLIPEKLRCLFIAFNRDIVGELSSKLKDANNVDVRTVHSLGLLMIRRNFQGIKNIEIDEFKYRTFIKKNIGNLTDLDSKTFNKREYEQYIDNVCELVKLGRLNLCQCEKEFLEVAGRHDLTLLDDECDTVLKVMKWGAEHIDTIDYTDMIWLPYELSLKPIGLQYDWIFIDECFPYDQYVATENGKMKIGRLYKMFEKNMALPLVKSYNEQTKTFEYKKITNVWKKGERELVEVIVGGKRIIRCTPNERFLTDSGYKYAMQLTKTDYLLSSGKTQPYHSFLNEDQKDVFLIHLIGDGNISKLSDGVYRNRIIHCEKQKEYIEWKSKLFNCKNIKYIKENGFSKKPAYSFNTLGYCLKDEDLNIEDIINNMSIKQLAINYQDNGSYIKNTSYLYSCVHNYEHISLLKKRIEYLGIDGVSIHESTSSTSHKKYFYLTINSKGTYILHSKIAQYINKSLEYKIHEDFKNLIGSYEWDYTASPYGGMKVSDVKFLNVKDTVYDIEVEDNHNFIITSGTFKTKYTNTAINEGFIVHNCQDLNNAQRELFLRCFKRGTRFVAIGDDSQAIYSFCGASPESFKKLQNLPNTTTLPLSVSYRCSKNVINFAKNIVPEIEAKEDAVDGEVVFNAHIKDIQKGDMVLCRNKMPLIKLYMRFLRMGIKSFVRGQDIGLNLLKMVNMTDKRELNVDLKKDGVFVRLYERLFEARNKLMIKRGLDIQDASTSDVVMSMYDSIKALEILSENIKTTDELILRINNVFMEDADSICLSTIHKAKGLEAKNVFILCKSLMPSKMAKQDWELEQERNLEYVAYTRAKEKLAFVNEKEVSPNAAMIDVSAALTELAYVEKTICKVLGKTPITEMSQEDAAKYAISIATELKPVEKTNSVKLDDTSNSEEEEKSDEEMMKELMKIVKKKGGLSKLKKLLNE